MQNQLHSKWELAIKNKLNSLEHNQIWELVTLPIGNKALYNKCIVKRISWRKKEIQSKIVIKG